MTILGPDGNPTMSEQEFKKKVEEEFGWTYEDWAVESLNHLGKLFPLFGHWFKMEGHTPDGGLVLKYHSPCSKKKVEKKDG